MRSLMDYQVRFALKNGFALISHDGLGASLWECGQGGSITLDDVKPTLCLIFNLGLGSIWRAMRALEQSEKRREMPNNLYLSNVGVLAEARGRGLGARLLVPVMEYCKTHCLPIYLETGLGDNVGFYKRLGFELVDTSTDGSSITYYLRSPVHDSCNH